MKLHFLRRGTPVAALAWALSSAAGAAPLYHLTDLGANTLATGVNDAGQVFGRYRVALAAIYADGQWSRVGMAPDKLVPRTGPINAKGAAVGYLDDGDQTAAVMWTASGRLVELFPGDDANSWAYGIGDDGAIIGQQDAIGGARAFVWKNGQVKWLKPPHGTDYVIPAAINAYHQIAGTAGDAQGGQEIAFFDHGTWQVVPGLDGQWAYATALNAIGHVAGISGTADGGSHAVFWDGGALVDLGTLGGDTSEALAVNGSDVVVGDSLDAGGTRRAFVVVDGAMLDLSTLVANQDDLGGWSSLQEAVGINDAGQIVGTGLRNGYTHSFMLTPVSK